MEALNRILLVDDDRVTNLMHKRQIVRRGLAHCIDIATDGQSALEYLNAIAADGLTPPELVLLDINMPRMNGFEFLDEYRLLPESLREGQRIIMVSTSILQSDEMRAECDICVSGFEPKPLSDTDLERIVRECQVRRDTVL